MACICFICEGKPDAELLCDLVQYSTAFYNVTSFEVSEREDARLLKVCKVCRDKLLQYDVFRTHCIKVWTNLKRCTNNPFVSPTFVQVGDNVNDIQHRSDDDWATDTELDIEEKPKSPAENIQKNDPPDNDVDEEYNNDACESDDDPFSEEGARVENDPKKGLVCDLCGRKFRNPVRFEGHLRMHQGLKPGLCKLCGKEFITYHNLKMHMLHNHSDEPRATFPCDVEGCDSSFATKQGMMTHRKKHDPEYVTPDPKTFVCETCGKTFSTIGALKKHSYIHTGNMPFHCEICDKRYPTAHKLKEHTMRHQGIKNHTCPHCGLKKTTRHELRVHMNYHTKEKTFPCDFCEQIFFNGGNLLRHVRIVHRKIKSFSCTHCSLSFAKAETLKHHVMTHTGERPHCCTVCDKRFIQLVALRKHAKVHEKNRPQKATHPSSSKTYEVDKTGTRTE